MTDAEIATARQMWKRGDNTVIIAWLLQVPEYEIWNRMGAIAHAPPAITAENWAGL